MLRGLQEGKFRVEEVSSAAVVQIISEKLKHVHNSMKNQRTAVLWTAYMKMAYIISRFIKAERTKNWSLHLQSVYDMLPYFTVACRRLYTKSAYIYLQMMNELQNIHRHIYKNFQNGLHSARTSDRFRAVLSTDFMIEQDLMRSVKTSVKTRGGLTLTGVRYSHVLQQCYICIYYVEESVLLETKPLVDSIRHFIRDPSGVFSVCHFCECRIVQCRHDCRLLLLLKWFLHIIKRTLPVGSKI